jgi:hypothetical protein
MRIEKLVLHGMPSLLSPSTSQAGARTRTGLKLSSGRTTIASWDVERDHGSERLWEEQQPRRDTSRARAEEDVPVRASIRLLPSFLLSLQAQFSPRTR